MALPLTIAILLFALLLLGAGLTIRSLLARNMAMQAQVLEISKQYADSALASQKAQALAAPKQAEKLVDALATATSDVVDSITASMTSVYGPAVVDRTAAEGSGADPMAPWYTEEGSMDFNDPTDAMNVEGILGPENEGNLDGLVVTDEPFGIPGLKVGG